MKKFSLSKLVLFAAIPALVLSSCKKETTDELPKIDFASETVSFEQDETTGKTIRLTSNRDWEITGVPDWATVTPTSGTGDQDIVIAPNEVNAGDYRTATITATISSTANRATLKIEQEGEGGTPGEAVTTFSEDFETIITNGAVFESTKWHFTSTASTWPSTDRYAGWHGRIFNDDKYIACAPYNESAEVTAYAVITSPFNVAEAADKTLKFELAFYYQAYDDSKIELVSSTDYNGDPATATWTVVETYMYAESDPMNDWIAQTADLSAYASQSSVYFAFRYVGNAITYRLDNVSFNGGAPAPTFGVNPTSMNVIAAGGEVTVNVTGNSVWTVDVTEGADYITDYTEGGTGAGDLKVTFTENENTEQTRTVKLAVATTASVTPNSYEVTFTQAKKSSGGDIPAGTVIFKETWGVWEQESTDGVLIEEYDFSGTILYDEDDIPSLSYQGGSFVKTYYNVSLSSPVPVSAGYEGASGGVQVLHPRNSRGETLVMSGIPIYGAEAIELQNATRNSTSGDATTNVTYEFNNGSTGTFTVASSVIGDSNWRNHTYSAISVPTGATTITLTFVAATDANIRGDDTMLIAR